MILITDDVAVTLEFGHEFVLVDDLSENAFVILGYGLDVRARCHPGLDVILILRHGNDLERGPVRSAILFSADLKDLAEAALAY